MEAGLEQVLSETPELDSELTEEKSRIVGVAASDNDGMCLMAKGHVDKSLLALGNSLSEIGKHFEEGAGGQRNPIVVIDTLETQLMFKKETDVAVMIVKNVANSSQ